MIEHPARPEIVDFREELYARHHTTHPDVSISSVVRQERYLPLLDGIDLHSPILELGCGSGHLLRFLREEGFAEVRGIDISEGQVFRARQKGLHVDRMDVFQALKGHEGVYDAVIAIDFIEHFSKEELLRLVLGIYNVLKPGGRFILQTPNGQGLFPRQVIYGDLTHVSIFTPASLTQLLRYAGFDRIEIREVGPFPGKWKGKLRFVLWHMVKVLANLCRKIEAAKSQEIWTENMICCCFRPP